MAFGAGWLTSPPESLPEAEVAAAEQRAHAQFFGTSHRFPKGGFRLRQPRAAVTNRQLPDQPVGVGLVASFTVLEGEIEGPASELGSFLSPAGRKVRLTEGHHP